LIQGLKKFAERVARDNVSVPTIEYTIVFAIVMALVLTAVAYVGTWIAEKWFLLTVNLP
jgi:Flp pilus assembly pilin Flp